MINLRQQAEGKQDIELSLHDANNIIDRINDSLSDIIMSLIIIGSESITSRYEIIKVIEMMKAKYVKEESPFEESNQSD